ncbi:MAG: hypothetical protein RQ754_12905 [Desulfuromonadales bacterium]|nr:hypothetical protein [Desulfuromonadales bacterium]
MKRILLFLLRTLLIAMVLFAAKDWLLPAYRMVIYGFCHLLPGAGAGVSLYNDSLDKFIPFAALLAAMPGMPWIRKVGMMCAGLAIFVAIDVSAYFFTTPTDIQQTGVYNTPPSQAFFWVWKAYGRWLLPLLLWLLASYQYLENLFHKTAVRGP